jgi:uncharacterized protein YcbK (DUF882 family)
MDRVIDRVTHRIVGSACALALTVGPAAADAVPSKKDRERAAKTSSHPAPPAARTKPAPQNNLYNQWTHEWLAVEVNKPVPQESIDRFFRDHFTNERTRFDAKLVSALVRAAVRFRADTVFIVSSFRHPKYNLMLRKKGRQVARDSEHTKGNAVDFFLPRIPIRVLHAWARQQRLGGVGIYLDSGFVHIDIGKIRYWSGE